MTRYSNTGLKFLDKNIEYEHIGTNIYNIFVVDKNRNNVHDESVKDLIELNWQLADIRYNDLNQEDVNECLKYYADIEDLEGTEHYKEAKKISNKLYKIFGIDLSYELDISF